MRDHFALLFALSAVSMLGCSEMHPLSTSALPPSPTEITTSDSSENQATPYPRLVASHVHAKDGEITEIGSPVSASGVERQFSKINWTKPASLGVHFDANTSLMIKCEPKEGDIESNLIAVWTRPENEAQDTSVCVVRQSGPLEGKQRALALLQAFAINKEFVESSTNWKVISRRKAHRPSQ